MDKQTSYSNFFTPEYQAELDNLPPLTAEEQKTIDLLAGLMVDHYFATIEKKESNKDE